MRFPHCPSGIHLLVEIISCSWESWDAEASLDSFELPEISSQKCLWKDKEGSDSLPTLHGLPRCSWFSPGRRNPTQFPNPKVPTELPGMDFCFFLFRVNSQPLPAWAGVIPSLSPKFLPQLFPGIPILFPPASGSIHSQSILSLGGFSWNFQSIPPFSL